MSFPVAVQSAIFYYLACTPCVGAKKRKEARKQGKREREEREQRHAEQPDAYRHPEPFNMNPYWEEEMTMGPSLPSKKGRAKAASQRKLNSAGKDSSVGTRSSLAISNGTEPTNPQGSPTLVPEDTRSMSIERSVTESTVDGWNVKRYQREDEELWGHEQSRTHKLMDAIVKAGSSAGRLLDVRLGKEKSITDEDRANFYSAPIHPPVNDFHPPVVASKPANKDALKWMLQPPPPAKVMEGKMPVSRTASMASSVGRRITTGSEASLARLRGERVLEAKLRRAESAATADGEKVTTPSLVRTGSKATAGTPRPRSRHSSRSSADSEDSSEGGPKRRRRRTRSTLTPATPEVESDEDRADYFGKGTAPSDLHAAQRPKLETILSSDASSPAEADGSPAAGDRRKENNSSLSKRLHDAARGSEVHSDPTSAKGERLTGGSIDSGLALSL